MKILAVGDPHGDLTKLKKIPLKNIDLILVTGDLGKADLMRKMAFDNLKRKGMGKPLIKYTPLQEKRAYMESFNSTMRVMRWLARYVPVYTIYGNVEMSDSDVRKFSKEFGIRLPLLGKNLRKIKNLKILNNRVVNFKGVRIVGLEYFTDVSWVKEFFPSNYLHISAAREETKTIKKILKRFGKVDILVHHQPPYGVLDKVASKSVPKNWKGKHAGSTVVLDYIRRKQPRYSVCGHIHEAKGTKKIGKTEVYNLGCCGYKILDV